MAWTTLSVIDVLDVSDELLLAALVLAIALVFVLSVLGLVLALLR
ncbi:hypothetical protein [Natronosalvus vescus]|nr:hypothetical protein [Natronosalvus vescus]